jgi:hypothetical protein
MPAMRRVLLVAALTAAFGCRKQPEAPHGSPVLLQVAWEVDGMPTIVWSRDPDASVAAEVSPAGSKIDFVFDRRLDGARVEDTIDGGPSPKADPPITVDWPDMATVMADPPFTPNVFYDSLPVWGPGTSFAFVQARIAGFPSATPITFTLDPNGLTSVYGEPMDGPTSITVMTAPLTVTLPAGTATVPTSYFIPIAFSTRAPAKDALKSFVHVSWRGAELPFDPASDATDARRLYVVPAACLGGWPADARLDVTVDPGLPDGFGRLLAARATGAVMTAHIAAPPVDGGCAPDAGAIDGAMDDGAGDAPTSDADDDGAPDGEPSDAQAAN